MIDLHAHVIPDIDDGPEAMAESLDMLRLAIQEGITHVVSTPHYKPPRFNSQEAAAKFMALKDAVAAEGLPIELSLGNEATLDEGLIEALKSGACLPLGASSNILLELPMVKFYPFHEQQLHGLQLEGYGIVLAHVERYPYLTESFQLLKSLQDRGCVAQVNSDSVVSGAQRSKVMRMIRSGLVQVVATDCHSTGHRRPALKKAYETVAAEFGETVANDLFHENPRRVLNNQPVVREWSDMKPEPFWRRLFK